MPKSPEFSEVPNIGAISEWEEELHQVPAGLDVPNTCFVKPSRWEVGTFGKGR